MNRACRNAQEFANFFHRHFAKIEKCHDCPFTLWKLFEKCFDDGTATLGDFCLLLFRYVMGIRGFLDFFHGCVLQRLCRKIFLSHPINTKPIGDDIQPPRKFIGVLECREFFVYLKERILCNLLGIVEIADLPPRKGVHTFLVPLNQDIKRCFIA